MLPREVMVARFPSLIFLFTRRGGMVLTAPDESAMIFQCDADGNPHYTVPRVMEIWPLLDCEQDLVGDERAIYEALSTQSHELNGASVSYEEIAKKLGWTVQRARAATDSLWARWVEPNL